MNFNKQQSIALGIALIVLGLVWWLDLWWLIWPGALAVAGVLAYRQRRRMGRPVEAVQAGLWCIGLALLFLFGFVWPGLLFLAGVSVLIRGREAEIDSALQATLAQARRRRATPRPITTQQVPITTQPAAPQPPSTDAPATGQTMRLRE